MLQSLILLLYCTGWAAAGSGDIVDNCNYTASPSQTRCGDICMGTNRNCICGGERLFTKTGPSHCCVDDSPEQCYIDGDGNANCPKGRVLNKTETCNNLCFNDYKASEVIGFDSQFRCDNTSCVPVWKMCRGYSMCEDRSDIRACDDTLTCVWRRGYKDKRQMEADLSNNHFYCNYGESRNEGQYDTITRLDEISLDIGKQKVSIDFSSLVTPCDDGVTRGSWCGDVCWPNYNWCREDRSLSCDVSGVQFTTNNRALCSNPTVWINQTCDNFYDSGRKAALGLQCAGEAQHCYYPWYLASNYYYEVREQLNI